jgi:histidinol-phosphatase (PHP family)
MSWPGVDYHTHICGTTIDQMLASASAKGVREYGVSEHIFQLDEGHLVFPHLVEEGIRFPRQWYVDACLERRRAGAVEIRLGLEVDFVPGSEEAVAAILAGIEWDYLIGSIHEIDGVDLFAHRPADQDEGRRLWTRYYELSIAAIRSGTFDVLAHPARNAVLNPFLPDDLDDQLLAVAEASVAHSVALEFNGEDTARWPELVSRLARACGRAGCPVSLGSDAHGPDSVARSLLAASMIGVEADVPGVVSFQRRDRRVIPFG